MNEEPIKQERTCKDCEYAKDCMGTGASQTCKKYPAPQPEPPNPYTIIALLVKVMGGRMCIPKAIIEAQEKQPEPSLIMAWDEENKQYVLYAGKQQQRSNIATPIKKLILPAMITAVLMMVMLFTGCSGAGVSPQYKTQPIEWEFILPERDWQTVWAINLYKLPLPVMCQGEILGAAGGFETPKRPGV